MQKTSSIVQKGSHNREAKLGRILTFIVLVPASNSVTIMTGTYLSGFFPRGRTATSARLGRDKRPGEETIGAPACTSRTHLVGVISAQRCAEAVFS